MVVGSCARSSWCQSESLDGRCKEMPLELLNNTAWATEDYLSGRMIHGERLGWKSTELVSFDNPVSGVTMVLYLTFLDALKSRLIRFLEFNVNVVSRYVMQVEHIYSPRRESCYNATLLISSLRPGSPFLPGIGIRRKLTQAPTS